MTVEINLLDWRTLAAALMLLGFLPGFVLRQVVRLYPKGHLRRVELVNELYAIKWIERPLFVAQQFETALTEGLVTRLHARRRRAAESLVAPTGLDGVMADISAVVAQIDGERRRGPRDDPQERSLVLLAESEFDDVLHILHRLEYRGQPPNKDQLAELRRITEVVGGVLRGLSSPQG